MEHIRLRTKHRCEGIYSIETYTNNKVYVGSAVNMYKRVFFNHLRELRKNIHGNKHLQNHFNKYGEDDLLFYVIEFVPKKRNEPILEFKNRLLKREDYWIHKFPNKFNMNPNASSNLGMRGCKHKTHKIPVQQTKIHNIDMYDFKGIFIKTYPNIKTITKDIGIPYGTIYYHIMHGYTTRTEREPIFCRHEEDINKILKQPVSNFKEKVNKKIPIYQFNTQGNFIKKYKNVAEAIKETKITTIYRYLNGHANKTKNYIWSFNTTPTEEQIKKANKKNYDINSKPIYQFNLCGKFIKKYEDVYSAAHYIQSSEIYTCLKNKVVIINNFVFSLSSFVTIKQIKAIGVSVDLYSTKGVLIKTFSCITDVADYIKMGRSTIIKQGLQNKNPIGDYIVCKQGEKITEQLLNVQKQLESIQNAKVSQFDLQGNFIAEYKNQSEAEKITGISGSAISSYLNNKNKRTKKFIWTHGGNPTQEQILKANDTTKHIDPVKKSRATRKGFHTHRTQKNKENKLIDQYDIKGFFIQTHKSRCEATLTTGIDATYILKCVQGKCVSAKGFFFVNHGESIIEKLKQQYLKSNPPTQKHVYQFSINGKCVAEYKSIAEAIHQTKLVSLSDCLHGKSTFSGDFIFKFENFITQEEIEHAKYNRIKQFKTNFPNF
jgi:group I intron endonuclease